jgi:hypothetical protein
MGQAAAIALAGSFKEFRPGLDLRDRLRCSGDSRFQVLARL